MSQNAINARRAVFHDLHQHGCFTMPNPWDIGTAVCLSTMGFKALATTSAGMAFSHGLPDDVTALSRDLVLAHIAKIVSATDLPVNADFQSGYAEDADGVAESVHLCIDTGVAGLSIEDATGSLERPLYEIAEAVERLRAARSAIDATDSHVLLTARAECFLVGHPDPLRESVRRLEAYAEAGADVLFAPGLRTADDIRSVVQAAGDKPVNVLVSADMGLRLRDLAELGVRRVSLGSALARAAWGGFLAAARPIAEQGAFSGLQSAAPFNELNALFREHSSAYRVSE